MKKLVLFSVYFFVIQLVSAQTTIQLGGGGSMNSFDAPVTNLGDYSYTQQLYTQDEILTQLGTNEVGNKILSIQFEYRGSAGSVQFNNWTVFMGNLNQNEFASANDWMPVSEMTEVYSGIVDVPNSSGVWFEITFTTPFEWDGTSNIVIAVDENSPGMNISAGFRAYLQPNSCLRSYGSTPINPSAAPSTYPSKARLGNKPIVRFTFSDVDEDEDEESENENDEDDESENEDENEDDEDDESENEDENDDDDDSENEDENEDDDESENEDENDEDDESENEDENDEDDESENEDENDEDDESENEDEETANINEQTLLNASWYPNPTNSKAYLSLNEGGGNIVVVYDEQGREVAHFVSHINEIELDLTTLNNGIYTVVVSNNNERLISKVIKH